MACVKLIFLCKVAYLFHTVLAIPAESAPPAGGQPFLNSLAVLFRSRPPWPTTFPSATNTLYTTPQKQQAVAVSSAPIPPSMLPGSAKQGILVAHPMNSSPMLINSINIKNSNNNNLQPMHSASVIKAIRSPNPHTFPNQNNNPSQMQPAGTISLTPLPAGPGQGPPHKPGFITIAVKRPVNAPFMQLPHMHPPNINFDHLNPPNFNNQQQQQQQLPPPPPHLQIQNQNPPQQFQNQQNQNQQHQNQQQQSPFPNQQQQQQLQIQNNNQNQQQQQQQQQPPQNNQNPFQVPQLPQQKFQEHQQVVELDQQQQGQQLQQLQQQLEHQQIEQQLQQNQKQLEQQEQEKKFHPQQFAEQNQEQQQFQPLSQHEEQNSLYQQQGQNENFILTTTPSPPTIKPVVDHFRISNRDFNSKYKPTTKSPMKLITAPLLSSDTSGNRGNGFPDPPTPPVFQSFSDNSITRATNTYSMEWPKSNSKFDSDYFDNNNLMNNDINNGDHVTSQTSTVGTRIKVIEGQSENFDNARKLSISALSSPTKLSPVRKSKVLSNFRPSPQLHSFEDTTTGLKSYISVPTDLRERERDGKMSSGFQASEAKYYPPYESGFRPIPFNHYAFLYGKTGATPKSQMENSLRQQYYSPWGSISTSTASTLPERTDRKLVHGTLSQLLLASDMVNQAPGTDPPFVPFQSHLSMKPNLGRQATTSSSENIEDWISGPHSNRRAAKGSKRKFPVFGGKTRKLKPILPKKCEKFHRFGFCPVTAHYPLETVEKIALRCSALLSHLIAPLPRADVRYDIIVSKNGSLLKGQTEKESGWSWKSFAGRPVCDTKEIKIIPGFAKNEAGQWLVVLQTEVFKQEAQISLCSPQGPNCHGANCREEDENSRTKCVQRFTAQRLAVLDPEDQERCPVVRSVFLPSACVCLTDPNEVQRQLYVDEIGLNNENSHVDDFESSPLEKRRRDPLEDLVTADSSRYGETELVDPEPDLEQEQEASSSVEREPRVSASNYIPVISVENPVANSTFMIITEKFTTNESTSSTESAESHRVSLSVSTTPNSIDDYL